MSIESQLQGVQQRIADIDRNFSALEASLAAAEQAGEDRKVEFLRGRLEKLDSRLLSLQDMLLRSQAPSKPCLQLCQQPLLVSFYVGLHL